ncbi:hypothetical protein ACFCYB_10395 [Streptomyces sp. NPDC056309]|uniref:hypothetical protein n=1 Tax=Streptomyces sp. NPDC056309 TaxID=3345781 RepID=UPI0035DF9006
MSPWVGELVGLERVRAVSRRAGAAPATRSVPLEDSPRPAAPTGAATTPVGRESPLGWERPVGGGLLVGWESPLGWERPVGGGLLVGREPPDGWRLPVG